MSADLWKMRGRIQRAIGFTVVRYSPPFKRPNFSHVAGWGLKPTSDRARALSEIFRVPYIALEDGFIRSVVPGPKVASVSMVTDRSGIYYRADQPSDLESLIAASASNADSGRIARARSAIAYLRSHALSKYNFAPLRSEADLGLDPSRRTGRVLLVDQTRGDSSIHYGLASEHSFVDMLEAAKQENPGSEIVVKLHPEVSLGTKSGYLANIGETTDVRIVGRHVNPWSLIEVVDRVYVVTSQLGFEALLAGKRVSCFGAPFYCGWGLTDDRVAVARRTARPTIEQLTAAVYFDYSRYVCPKRLQQISFEEAAAMLLESRRKAVGY